MPRTWVKVEGLRELERSLAELPKALAKGAARRTLVKAGTPMKQTARRLAPDDPATPDIDLNTSIEISSRQKSGRQRKRTREGKAAVTVYIGPTKEGYPQAIYQEFGTVHHGAQPYMRPAWDAHKMEALETVKVELGEEITRTAARLAKRNARLAKGK
ncbi:MAG TPA: HK97-gp10 family putative phage morphogenesis protein [Rhizobiaceae bacterium]|nr:HK97-gp10 family putative phage morphogenesis protein [Rhizobiaceae bacterium]